MPARITRHVADMVAEAEAVITALPPEAAIALHGDPGVLFVDLRDPRERTREGTIPGAFPCPRGMLEFWIDPDSPYAKPAFQQDRRFVFYCAGGLRSALATRTAQEMGLAPVAHLTGGFGAWRAAGGPVEPVPERGEPGAGG